MNRIRYISPPDEHRERYAVTAMTAYNLLYNLFKDSLDAGIDVEICEGHMLNAFQIQCLIEHKIPEPDINFTMHVLNNRKLFSLQRDNSPVEMKPIKGTDIGGCKMPLHLYGINFETLRAAEDQQEATQ